MAEAYKHHFYGHAEREMKRFLGLMLLDPARFLDYTREYCGRVMSRLAWDEATQGRGMRVGSGGVNGCVEYK